ncbi:MAG TPA: SpoIIE family protein phosphatase [Gaiellaceae bacterium]|nr:SpoIIE family protein phosphatase [Gaiellaceae bacterium]
MAVDADRRARAAALEALAEAGAAAARTEKPLQALRALLAAAATAAGADLALVRTADGAGTLVVRAAVGFGAWPARLEGTRGEEPDAELALARLAEDVRASDVLALPLESGGRLELLRVKDEFDAEEAAAARVAASQMALVVRASATSGAERVDAESRRTLRLAGDGLAAGTDAAQAADHVLRVALEVSKAHGALLWRCRAELDLEGSVGETSGVAEARARAAAARSLEHGSTQVEELENGVAVSLRVGEPPVGVLQLLFARDRAPDPEDLEALATFAVRAAHGLREAERVRDVAAELDQSRALLAAVGQATAHLSLAHTLEIAVARVAEIIGTDRVAVYLRDEGRLVAAAEGGLAGPHARVAEGLLELALGAFRARGMVVLPDASHEPRLLSVSDAVAEAGIECVVALPLVVAEEVVGLLVAYPPRAHELDANRAALLGPLAGQLAVAVQNARLHEEATRLGNELETALGSERDAARRLRALYEISRSFAQSLRLDVTLDAVARTVVEHLDVDAAVIRLPDPRREVLLPRAMHVADDRLEQPMRSILFRPHAFGHEAMQRVFRARESMILDVDTAPLLAPFLAKGSTAAVVPLATPGEVIAAMTIVSLEPARPITAETIDAAQTIGVQAALAIENARLYQQQKEFADSMQRALLPQVRPAVLGIDIGEVYAASARMDIGGDLYDYIGLADGRLAVVVGDVTGHGVDAAADMAMAKFVFRSLAREHPQPSDFLATANEVVVDEIAPGKFITMVYLLLDPATGELLCASAGHPPPRVVRADGSVDGVAPSGLALGVDAGQTYDEVSTRLEPGEFVVLYTDGVIEARVGAELYGIDRLDSLLARRRTLRPEDVAASVIQAARRFTGGELLDDCAVVVVKRLG